MRFVKKRKRNLLAWLLIFCGLLLVIGGSIIFFYKAPSFPQFSPPDNSSCFLMLEINESLYLGTVSFSFYNLTNLFGAYEPLVMPYGGAGDYALKVYGLNGTLVASYAMKSSRNVTTDNFMNPSAPSGLIQLPSAIISSIIPYSSDIGRIATVNNKGAEKNLSVNLSRIYCSKVSCKLEGQNGILSSGDRCCAGLTMIQQSAGSFGCSSCGNGICSAGEDAKSCPSDCFVASSCARGYKISGSSCVLIMPGEDCDDLNVSNVDYTSSQLPGAKDCLRINANGVGLDARNAKLTYSDVYVFGSNVHMKGINSVNIHNNGSLVFEGQNNISLLEGESILLNSDVVLNVSRIKVGNVNVNGGRLNVNAPKGTINILGSLDLINGGRLNLGNSYLIVRNISYGKILQYYLNTSLRFNKTPGKVLGIVERYSRYSPDGMFWGEPITSADLVAMPTLAGDANLDGFISIDDYLSIDAGFLFGMAGTWNNGDFNYDGVINAYDYALIDGSFVSQGTPQAADIASMHSGWFGAEYSPYLDNYTYSEDPASASLTNDSNQMSVSSGGGGGSGVSPSGFKVSDGNQLSIGESSVWAGVNESSNLGTNGAVADNAKVSEARKARFNAWMIAAGSVILLLIILITIYFGIIRRGEKS